MAVLERFQPAQSCSYFEALADFFARFEPSTADEDAVLYNGDVEVIRSVVR
ncbi:hypothetical protein ACFV19_14920 [Streptomyces griseoluteus]|uniref:hypothetical protein n=1 Tax=Streptomyces griseoluteus TaxID=29306 RepID=UPI0036923517